MDHAASVAPQSKWFLPTLSVVRGALIHNAAAATATAATAATQGLSSAHPAVCTRRSPGRPSQEEQGLKAVTVPFAHMLLHAKEFVAPAVRQPRFVRQAMRLVDAHALLSAAARLKLHRRLAPLRPSTWRLARECWRRRFSHHRHRQPPSQQEDEVEEEDEELTRRDDVEAAGRENHSTPASNPLLRLMQQRGQWCCHVGGPLTAARAEAEGLTPNLKAMHAPASPSIGAAAACPDASCC